MEAVPTSPAPAEYRWVMSHFCTGVAVITARHGTAPVGLTCQSLAALSIEPPLIMFGVSRRSRSWPRVRAAGVFAVNILSEDQEPISRRFAISGGDKFAGVGWRAGAGGAPLLDGALAHIECVVAAVYPGGDHDIVVGRVLDLRPGPADGRPLLYFRSSYGAVNLSSG